MAGTLTPREKSNILDELVRNTGADREFAHKLLQENNWQFRGNYDKLEKLCIESAHRGRVGQCHMSDRGTPIPIQHVGSPSRAVYGQRGGGAYPPSYTNTGIGRAGSTVITVNKPGTGYDSVPAHRHTSTVPNFPVHPDDFHDRRARSQLETGHRVTERIVPIQVEKGPAVKLPDPIVPQQAQVRPLEPRPFLYKQHDQQRSSPQQQHRVLPSPQPQQGYCAHPPQQAPLQRQVNIQETMPLSAEERARKAMPPPAKPEDPKDAGKTGDHTPKLKRGISNIMENVNLVSEARSSVLHDIEEDSHDHMYLLTFILPDLTVYSEDFRAYLEKDLIETSTLVSLEQAGRLNWWAEMRICQRLLPMATSGDGNCLLHAASLAMWGIHDRQLILRNALYHNMTSANFKDNLYRRWRWQQTLSNKESGLVLSEDEWKDEWDNLLRLSSPTPRTLPETCKRTSCCDSPVTQGNTSNDPVVYESLEDFHVFVLAHVLQRPIIVVADTVLKDSSGEALAPIPFGGIYLPLECNPKTCYRSPLLLTYDAAHFSALVPMEMESSPEEKPYLPAAIPLVDPSFQLLPLHFHIDPGPHYCWSKGTITSNKKLPELSTEDKLNLLQMYMNVEKLQIPVLDSDYDSDRQSCGSYESDDSVGCVGNKEKKKEAKMSQQMHSVAKQFGSIGKTMGKKIKKNFGSIGKAMKNIGDHDKGSRRRSVGSVITQSTKVIATIATDIGKDRVWCARLSLSRTKMQEDLVKNYLHTSEQRFEKDRELWRRKNEEIRNRVSNPSLAACVTPGCNMFGTAETAYLCSKCYHQQKQEAIDKEKGKPIVYNTFPGRNKAGEDAIVKLGKSKFYTGAEDCPDGQYGSRDSLTTVNNIDRQQSRSVGDVSRSVRTELHGDRTPSPDYDNLDYRTNESQQMKTGSVYGTAPRPQTGLNQPTSRTQSVFIQPTATRIPATNPVQPIARPTSTIVQSSARPPSGQGHPVSRPVSSMGQPAARQPPGVQTGYNQSVGVGRTETSTPSHTKPATVNQRPSSSTGNKCRTENCNFFGSPESENLCSKCYRQRQQFLQSQARCQTRL